MQKLLTTALLTAAILVLTAGCAPAPDAPEDPAPRADTAAEEVEPSATSEAPTPEPEPTAEPADEEAAPPVFSLTSPAFNQEEPIPVQFSCDGDNISPELVWTGVPEGTASLVLIMDDPDAPGGTWDHWLLFNIPPDLDGIPQGGTAGTEGSNSWGRTGYGGPCPPGGTHRYFFKLYALDVELELEEGAGKAEIEGAMEDHILAQTELMGTFSR